MQKNDYFKANALNLELVLSMLFITCVLSANFLSTKPIMIGPLLCTTGIFAYPFSLMLVTLCSENRGFHAAKRMVHQGISACLVTSLTLHLITSLPGPTIDYFTLTQRILWGSIFGFYAGDLSNAAIVAYCRQQQLFSFWSRALIGVLGGEFISGALFTILSYYAIPNMPLLTLWLDVFVLKIAIMMVCLPLLHIGQQSIVHASAAHTTRKGPERPLEMSTQDDLM